MASRVRVFIACSLDGFIAGPDDDLSWLEGHDDANASATTASEAVSFESFMTDVGALLMGRRTHDIVNGFGVPWPYGSRPVLVATQRPLQPAAPSVRAVSGNIEDLVAQARAAADGRDVYVDGGNLIRQAIDADLIDEAIVTFAPIVLGRGYPLFAGVSRRHRLRITAHTWLGGMVQLRLEPRRS